MGLLGQTVCERCKLQYLQFIELLQLVYDGFFREVQGCLEGCRLPSERKKGSRGSATQVDPGVLGGIAMVSAVYSPW